MKKSIYATASLAAAALALAACGAAPEDETPETDGAEPPAESEVKACMVSDQGGYDDQSFNQSGKEGLDSAAEAFGIETNAIESTTDADYAPNIDSLISEGCTYIIGVGFLLEQGIQDAADANPDLHFALIDGTFADDDDNPVELDNAKPLLFNTAEAAFLAGYVAGGMTETGTVGTFGGLPIPSVQIFMDGFADGIEMWNEDNDDEVILLGWDKETQEGQFSGDFENQAAGQNITEGFLQQGADIVMPVAGPVGLGAAAAIEGVEGGMIIWVDSDGYESTDYGSIILTSVMKGIAASVEDAVGEQVDGSFTAEPYIGTLENDGVGLGPFHEFDSEVPAELSERVEELRQQIISGELVVETPNAP